VYAYTKFGCWHSDRVTDRGRIVGTLTDLQATEGELLHLAGIEPRSPRKP
jgi:hypothetical protein